MTKLSPSQNKWLRAAANNPTGELIRPRPTYDMAGRMRDEGLFDILKERDTSELEWPWGNWKLRITPAGRAALEQTDDYL